MTVTFIPKSEQQITNERLLPKGQYYFDVLECEEKQGKSCVYFKIKHRLTPADNNISITWYDNLVIHDDFQWRLRHACQEMGILDKYEQGSLSAEDFLHCQGILIVDHRIRKDNGMLEAYIKDYGVKSNVTTSVQSKGAASKATYNALSKSDEQMLNDPVPF
jgi:hypothetical protein